jgi:hypothetical protein
MPLSLEEVRNRTAKCDVYNTIVRPGMGKGDLNVEYYIIEDSGIDDVQDQLRQITDKSPEGQMTFYTDNIVRRVASWDLSIKPGDPAILITAEELRAARVPTEVMNDVLEAIAKDVEKRKNSAPRRGR